MVLRTKLITHVIHFTLRSFLGLDPPEIRVLKNSPDKGPRKPNPVQDLHKEIMKLSMSSGQVKELRKETLSAMKERASQRVTECACCAMRQPTDAKFSRCKPCWENVKRTVVYCSRECQKKDWKARHKILCGRTLDFETAEKAAMAPRAGSQIAEPVSDTGRIGPAVGGFKRSPALVLLVTRLNEHPKVDYFFVVPTTKEWLDSDYNNPKVRAIVRRRRNQACTTGDRESVAILCHFFCWIMTAEAGRHAVKPRVNAKTITMQMTKEFEYDGLSTAVLELQEKAWEHPLKKPYVLTP
ncbi:hypothetical protein HGRIS_001774 [Hohenbuehelia grisea]|uniref:MYND-type domain-containing protein n=1 Tax=Hohenbuehelia grisea TaxID=104357 RepID=A0ABR3JJ47_9AGAR